MSQRRASQVGGGLEKTWSMVPEEYYWISNDEFEYIPMKYVGPEGTISGTGHKMIEFVAYGATNRVKAPSSRIRGRIPAPAELHLDPKNIKSDLVQNDDVSEPAVLWAIRQRYTKDLIYSSIGSILIAINPYKKINDLYTRENMAIYTQSQLKVSAGGTPTDLRDLVEPHIWGIAAQAYSQMRRPILDHQTSLDMEEDAQKYGEGSISGGRQAVIISGESGAGKTEATKMCLQLLSALAHVSPANEGPSLPSSPGRVKRKSMILANSSFEEGEGSASDALCTETEMDDFHALPIEDRVLGTNPLLESFGNAKTARNNNSSRFGKWLEIKFEYKNGKGKGTHTLDEGITGTEEFEPQEVILCGANITEYLLEKSRVVFQANEERNYHIFYQICSDPSMGMGPASSYSFLSPPHGDIVIDGVDDAEDFMETKFALNDLGFTREDQDAVFDCVKAVMTLGNIEFDGFSANTECKVRRGDSTTSLTTSATLLGIPPARLSECLTQRTMTIRGETMHMVLDVAHAVETRNAFAKEIYGRLFSHIVYQINKALQPAGQNKDENLFPQRKSSDLCIGMLDIFGFEIFERNSFEQLCINYANEKLQQYFIAFVLKKEQEVYVSEELNITQVVPRDNEDVLRLIEEKPNGLLSRLDEEVKLSGNDQAYLRKIDRDHNKNDSSKSRKSTAAEESRRFNRTTKTKVGHFEIRHFAGVVAYDSDGFVEKNKDKLYDHLEALIDEFENQLIKDLMRETHKKLQKMAEAALASKKGGRRNSTAMDSSVTLSARFQWQLNDLMGILNKSSPHFVRCIKPNNMKKPDYLKLPLVLQQLRYSGVLEAIQIRKAGFPIRRKHRDFWRSYWSLALTPTSNGSIAFERGDEKKTAERSGIDVRAAAWRRLSEKDKCRVILLGLNVKAVDHRSICIKNEQQRLKDTTGLSELNDAARFNVTNAWTMQVYHHSQLILGKSLVFFKPETLTALEKEKIRRGKSAILFVQSCARRDRHVRLFKIMHSKRRELQRMLEVGKERGCSNISVLVQLERCTHECRDDLKMIWYGLKDCEVMITRLTAVADCIFRMRFILSMYYPSKYRSSFAHYVDHPGVSSKDTERERFRARAMIAAMESDEQNAVVNEDKNKLVNLQYDRDLVEDFRMMTSLLAEARGGIDEFQQANPLSDDPKRRGSSITVAAAAKHRGRLKSITVIMPSDTIDEAKHDSLAVDNITTGLNIDAVEVNDLLLKRAEFEDRANGLLVLRQAINDRNEDSLKAALRHVGILNLKYQNLQAQEAGESGEVVKLIRENSISGDKDEERSSSSFDFCEREEAEGKELLARLMGERYAISEISSIIGQFHQAYSDRLHQQQWVKQAAITGEDAELLNKFINEDSDASSIDSGEVNKQYWHTVESPEGKMSQVHEAVENTPTSEIAQSGHEFSDEIAHGDDGILDKTPQNSVIQNGTEKVHSRGDDDSSNEELAPEELAHYHSGKSIYNSYWSTENETRSADEVDEADYDPHKHGAFATSGKEWGWFSNACLKLNGHIQSLTACYTTEENVATASREKCAAAKLSGEDDNLREVLLLSAPMAMKIFDTLEIFCKVNELWAGCNWEELFDMVTGLWTALSDIRALTSDADAEAQCNDTDAKTSSVAVELLQLTLSLDALIETHVTYLRKDLERHFILPLLQGVLHVGECSMIMKDKQKIYAEELERISNSSTDSSRGLENTHKAFERHHDEFMQREKWREAYERVWSLRHAIRGLEEKCSSWATPKLHLVLNRARVLSLARLSFYYERWPDLIRLCEDARTGSDRHRRHDGYRIKLTSIGIDCEDAYTLLENSSSSVSDTAGESNQVDENFTIDWDSLTLASIPHTVKSIEKLLKAHAAKETGGRSLRRNESDDDQDRSSLSSVQRTSISQRVSISLIGDDIEQALSEVPDDSFERDVYLDTAQLIEAELMELRMISTNEYCLAVLNDAAVLGRIEKYGAKTVATPVPIELAIMEIDLVCKLMHGAKQGISLLDSKVQMLYNEHFNNQLSTVRHLASQQKWEELLSNYFYAGRLPIEGKNRIFSSLAVLSPSNSAQHIGFNFHKCLMSIQEEYDAVPHKVFNEYYIKAIQHRLAEKRGRISTGWAIGTMTKRAPNADHIEEMLTELTQKCEEQDQNYQDCVQSGSLVSVELQFFADQARDFCHLRRSMVTRESDVERENLDGLIERQLDALLPFQDKYGLLTLNKKQGADDPPPHPFASLTSKSVRRELHKMLIEFQHFKCVKTIYEVFYDTDGVEVPVDYIISVPEGGSPEDFTNFENITEPLKSEINRLLEEDREDAGDDTQEKPTGTGMHFGMPLLELLQFFAEDKKTLDFTALSRESVKSALQACEDLDISLEQLQKDFKRRQITNREKKAQGNEVSDSSDDDDEEESVHSRLAISPHESTADTLSSAPHNLLQTNTVTSEKDSHFTLPDHIQRAVRALFTLKKLRIAFVKGRWVEVKSIIQSAIASPSESSGASIVTKGTEEDTLVAFSDSIAGQYPQIMKELTLASIHVDNYLLLSACEKAIAPSAALNESGHLHGSVMEHYDHSLKLHTDSLSKLDECLHLCNEIGCVTKRSQRLKEAVEFLRNLRIMQIKGWKTEDMRHLLVEGEVAGLGGSIDQVTKILSPTLRAAKIQLRSYSLLERFEELLKTEGPVLQNFLVTVEKPILTEGNGADTGLAVFLDECLQREAAAHSHILSLIMPVGQAADELYVTTSTNVASCRGASVDEIRKLTYGMEQSLAAYVQSFETFKLQYDLHYGEKGVHPSKEFGVYFQTHKLVLRIQAIIVSDIDKLSMHIMFSKLYADMCDALIVDGFHEGLMGCFDPETPVDLTSVRYEHIDKLISLKEEYMSDARVLDDNTTLMDSVEQLFVYASLLVSVREQIGNSECNWNRIDEEVLPKLRKQYEILIEFQKDTYDNLSEQPILAAIPEGALDELICLEKESLHRWVCSHVTAALKQGAPIDPAAEMVPSREGPAYPLSAALISCSEYAHLQGCLDRVHEKILRSPHIFKLLPNSNEEIQGSLSLKMPTELASSLVYTVELLIPLRRMLCDEVGSTIWELVAEVSDRILVDPFYQHVKMKPKPEPNRTRAKFISPDDHTATAATTASKPLSDNLELVDHDKETERVTEELSGLGLAILSSVRSSSDDKPTAVTTTTGPRRRATLPANPSAPPPPPIPNTMPPIHEDSGAPQPPPRRENTSRRRVSLSTDPGAPPPPPVPNTMLPIHEDSGAPQSPPRRENTSRRRVSLSTDPGAPQPPPRRETTSQRRVSLSTDPGAPPPPPVPNTMPPIHEDTSGFNEANSEAVSNQALQKPLLKAVHPCVQAEVAFISRLANDLVICAHMAQALRKPSLVRRSKYISSLQTSDDPDNPLADMETIVRCSRDLDSSHSESGDNPLPQACYKSPMHSELFTLCEQMLSLREAVIQKFRISQQLELYSLTHNDSGLYEIYRALENEASNKGEALTEKSHFPFASRRKSTGTPTNQEEKLSYAKALALKQEIDDMTAASLEAHRKAQILVEDVADYAKKCGPRSFQLITEELRFIRSECHFTDVQNSLSDTCIRAVRHYQKISQQSLRELVPTLEEVSAANVGNSPANIERPRRTSSAGVTDLTTDTGLQTRRRSSSGITELPSELNSPNRLQERKSIVKILPPSPSGSPAVASESDPAEVGGASTLTSSEEDDQIEAKFLLEDLNYVLHAASAQPIDSAPLEGDRVTDFVRLATILLEMRELALINNDIQGLMQMIATMQQQHNAEHRVSTSDVSNGTSEGPPQRSLLTLMLCSPYVRMEIMWLYRHVTNRFVVNTLIKGVTYSQQSSQDEQDSDDEFSRSTAHQPEDSMRMPNDVAIYMHGSALLTDTRHLRLSRAIADAETFTSKVISPRILTAAATGNCVYDIFGNELGTEAGESRPLHVGGGSSRSSVSNMISSMNTSFGPGRLGSSSKGNSELYTSTDTLMVYCKSLLNMRRSLVSRDSDSMLSTIKQWLQVKDVTKRDGTEATPSASFSRSSFLKPITGSQRKDATHASSDEQWQQLPPSYLQELKNVFICHQNDLLVVSLVDCLKDNGISPVSTSYSTPTGSSNSSLTLQNRKEWADLYSQRLKRLSKLDLLLHQFDKLVEDSRMQRRFSYQPSSVSAPEGITMDCQSDRGEDVILSCVLSNNSGRAFVWSSLHELVAISRLVLALRRWLADVDHSYAPCNISIDSSVVFLSSSNSVSPATPARHSENDRITEEFATPGEHASDALKATKSADQVGTGIPTEAEEAEFLAVGSDLIAALEDRAPPPGDPQSPAQASRRTFGLNGGNINAKIAPYSLITKELELAQTTVEELRAMIRMREAILGFHTTVMEFNDRSYCLRNMTGSTPKKRGVTFSPLPSEPSHGSEPSSANPAPPSRAKRYIAEIDSETVSTAVLDDAIHYVSDTQQLALNTSLGSAPSTTPGRPAATTNKYDKHGNKIFTTPEPNAKKPNSGQVKGISIGTSTNTHTTRLYNTITLLIRLRKLLKRKDDRLDGGLDDWLPVRDCLQKEGLLSDSYTGFYEHEKLTKTDDIGFVLNKNHDSDNYREYYRRNYCDSTATPMASGDKVERRNNVRCVLFLHEPIDTELRCLVQQVQIRKNFLILGQMLRDDRWWVPPRGIEEKEVIPDANEVKQSVMGPAATPSKSIFDSVADSPDILMSPEAKLEAANNRAVRDLTIAVEAAEEFLQTIAFKVPSEGKEIPRLDSENELFGDNVATASSQSSSETKPGHSLESLMVKKVAPRRRNHHLEVIQKVDSAIIEQKAKSIARKKDHLDKLLEKDKKFKRGNAPTAEVPVFKPASKRKPGRMTIMESMVTGLHKPKTKKPTESPNEVAVAEAVVAVPLKRRGPTEATMELLIRTAKLVISVRKTLMGPNQESMEVQSTFTESFSLSSLVRARLQGGEREETVALTSQAALGLKMDGSDTASIIVNSEIRGVLASADLHKAIPVVHPFSVPEFRFYYKELNDYHRQLQTICANLFAKYNKFRVLVVSCENTLTKFIGKAQQMATFSGGYYVSNVDCITWLLLGPNSNRLVDLPQAFLSRVGRPKVSEDCDEIGASMREARRILTLTTRAYGPNWYRNTLPRVKGTKAGSEHCDLGLVLLILCIKDAFRDYSRCQRILSAITAIVGNGEEYMHTYQCLGDEATVKEAFDPTVVEAVLMDAFKFRIFANEEVITLPENFKYREDPDGLAGVIISHYRRLNRFQNNINALARQAGIAPAVANDVLDEKRYQQELFKELMNPEYTATILELAKELGHGMWEHPIALCCHAYRRHVGALASANATAHITIARSVLKESVSDILKITLTRRKRDCESNLRRLEDYRWLRSGVSLKTSFAVNQKPLTALPPLLGSLAIWVSSNLLHPLCKPGDSFKNLKMLVTCGRTCRIMRVELLLQVMLRCSSDHKATKEAMWITLFCMLSGFAPPRDFEPFLESWLLEAERNSSTDSLRGMIEKCRASMHLSIFLHGYDRQLPETMPPELLKSLENSSSKIGFIWDKEVTQHGYDGIPAVRAAQEAQGQIQAQGQAKTQGQAQADDEAKAQQVAAEVTQEAKDGPHNTGVSAIVSKIFDDSDESESELSSEGKRVDEESSDEPLSSGSNKVHKYIDTIYKGLPDSAVRAWRKK